MTKQTTARKTRDDETRDQDDRAEATWTQASLLEAPPARPGMRQRWIATSIQGKPVPHQVMKKFREGWVPRKPETVPEDFPVPTLQHGQHAGCIGVEDMILCEMPKEKAVARAKFFKTRTDSQTSFVDAELDKAARKGGIPINRDHKRSSTRGRKVMDD